MTDRDQLITSHIPLAESIAKRRANAIPKPLTYGDVLSAAYMGLVKAADSFDPARGNKFSTHATHRINGEIIDQFRAFDWVPRLERKRTKKSGTATVMVQPGEVPSLGWVSKSETPLDTAERKDTIRKALKRLSSQDRLIFTLRYGEGLSMDEIGKVLGLSATRVSQLCSKLGERCFGRKLPALANVLPKRRDKPSRKWRSKYQIEAGGVA